MSNTIKIELTDELNKTTNIKGVLSNATETINTNTKGKVITVKKVFKSNDGTNYTITLERSSFKKVK